MLYKGDNFKLFLVDRYAMGFDTDMIKNEFEQLHGITITDSDIAVILKDSEDEIRARETEIAEKYKSTNIFNQLSDIKNQLNSVRQTALDNHDMKSYVQLTNSVLKSVELLLKALEGFKRHEETKALMFQQNNYFAIEALEKDGLIKVIEMKKLKKVMGVPEEENGDSVPVGSQDVQ